MLTEFNGGSVAGGSYPAQIWGDYMGSAKGECRGFPEPQTPFEAKPFFGEYAKSRSAAGSGPRRRRSANSPAEPPGRRWRRRRRWAGAAAHTLRASRMDPAAPQTPPADGPRRRRRPLAGPGRRRWPPCCSPPARRCSRCPARTSSRAPARTRPLDPRRLRRRPRHLARSLPGAALRRDRRLGRLRAARPRSAWPRDLAPDRDPARPFRPRSAAALPRCLQLHLLRAARRRGPQPLRVRAGGAARRRRRRAGRGLPLRGQRLRAAVHLGELSDRRGRRRGRTLVAEAASRPRGRRDRLAHRPSRPAARAARPLPLRPSSRSTHCVLVHVVGGAHNDGLMVAVALAGVVAVLSARPLSGGALLVSAVAVKAAAALYLPFALLGSRERATAARRGAGRGRPARRSGALALRSRGGDGARGRR